MNRIVSCGFCGHRFEVHFPHDRRQSFCSAKCVRLFVESQSDKDTPFSERVVPKHAEPIITQTIIPVLHKVPDFLKVV